MECDTQLLQQQQQAVGTPIMQVIYTSCTNSVCDVSNSLPETD